MRKYAILADANCDLSRELQQQYDITIVPTHILLPDGRDIPSFLEWKEFDRDKFYADLKADPDGFSTAPPNITEYENVFSGYAEKGEDVLLLTISSGISGSFNFALQAKKEIEKKFPEMNIRCVDTRRFGPAFGMLAIQAAEKRDEGLSLDDTAEYIEANKNRLHQAGWLDDLSFLAKKGRITNAKAFFGTLVGVKPIGEFDYNGLTTVIGKVKGAKAAYDLLLKYVEKTIEKPEEQTIVIAHTCRLPQAEIYREKLMDAIKPRAIRICDVFPMCGISIGPGLMAAYYMGKEISEGLVDEKRMIEESLNELKK